MSRDEVEKAEIERVKKAQETQEKADKERTKTTGKAQEQADKVERHRVEKAREVQEKARVVQEKTDKVEKDRVEKARLSERARLFDEILSGVSARSKGCCDPCNFHVKPDDGEYQTCKLGHEDSGPNKEICADCSEPRYHPKRQ